MPGDFQVICGSMVGENLQSPVSTETPDLQQDFKSESIELFGALQKHRKNAKIDINNFEKLRTLFLQNILTQKEINIKIR